MTAMLVGEEHQQGRARYQAPERLKAFFRGFFNGKLISH
jgi:hypothetical protein